jgi:hypothetical protein
MKLLWQLTLPITNSVIVTRRRIKILGNILSMISPQIDKCLNINGHAQLPTNIRYIDGDVTASNFFFCKERPKSTTDNDVSCYWRTSARKWNEMEELIQSLHWRGGLDDGLSEMLHSDCGRSDSISKVWPPLFFTVKLLLPLLCLQFSRMCLSNKINYIHQSWLLKLRPYFGIVPGTTAWTQFWPTSNGSRLGLVLTPAFKHRDEVQAFLKHQEEEDTQILVHDKWVVKLA